MTVRMEKELKKSFEKLCSEFGLSANAALNVFAKAAVQKGRLPFDFLFEKTKEKTMAEAAKENITYNN